MVGAYFYLTGCSLKNRTMRRVRRLREPRYLAGTIIGLVYLYFMVFRQGRHHHAMAVAPQQSAIEMIAGPLELVGALALFVFAIVAWVVPGIGQALRFTRAEVQFLFTAPVTRRALVHYKLLRSQIGIIFGSVIATVFLRPGSFGRGWIVMLGLWLVLAVIRLHLMGVALNRTSLWSNGLAGLTRQWRPLVVLTLAIAALTRALTTHWAAMTTAAGADAVVAALGRAVSEGPVSTVLFPFRALMKLPLSASPADFVMNLGPVAVLLALNYVWVLRSDAAFEETAAHQAEEQATRSHATPAAPKAAGSQPFVLAPQGRPEFAILWKNLILLGRYASGRTLLRFLPLVIVVGILARSAGAAGGFAPFLAALSVPLAVMVVFFGPQIMRNDLRQDLANLAFLKTWPISGAALVRGSVLAPTVALSGLAWAVILLALSASKSLPLESGTLTSMVLHRVSYAVAAALVFPAVILTQTIIHNAMAIVFPSWAALGASRARGIDAMGQRLLMLAGLIITLAVAILPGTLAGGVVFLAAKWLLGVTLIILPAAVFAAVILVESWVATELLGRVLARTDVSAIDAIE
jgi:ABC-2 type transport system permease protein